MLRRQLITDVVVEAVALLEAGFGVDLRREERLRAALVQRLEERPEVVEVRWSPEWQPELPHWPRAQKKQPGGFDLAVRFGRRRLPLTRGGAEVDALRLPERSG